MVDGGRGLSVMLGTCHLPNEAAHPGQSGYAHLDAQFLRGIRCVLWSPRSWTDRRQLIHLLCFALGRSAFTRTLLSECLCWIQFRVIAVINTVASPDVSAHTVRFLPHRTMP